ncbi:MAG: transcriptional regulator [Lactobacillales bacterium]|nr:transcriptional regulator [Lactobacillales bacterium]
MGKNKKNTKNKVKSKKKINIFSRIIGIIFNILLIVFLGLLIYMDVLPTKYFSIIVSALVVIAIIINLILFIPKVKTKLKVPANFFAVVFSAVFALGINYLYNTVDFLDNITSSGYQVENYYVVVLDNETFFKIEDLKGYKMGIHVTENDTYKKARKKLEEKVKTKNTDYEDTTKLANDLLEENVDAIFISESYKAHLDEEKEGFEGKTKILDTISIKTKTKDIAKEVEVTEESFNIYISGIDTFGTISSVSRSDVNMIVTVNPNTHEILLTSIPRDYYVQLSGTKGLKDKLTHAGIYGVNKSIKTLEELLDIEINYYVKVNFTTVVDIVDVIGGVDVYSDKSFRSYTDSSVYVKKGNNHFNGKQALAFSRERYAYKEGDRHRVKNQQDVLTAIMNKVLSSKTIISKYNSLLNTLEGSFQTNMNMDNITSLVKKQIDSMPSWTIVSQSVNGTDKQAYTHSYPGQQLYVMEPDMETVKAAKVKIEEVLNKKK